MKISLSHFNDKINTEGYVIFQDFIDKKLVQRMLIDLQKAYEFCRKIQVKNDIENSENTCHHLIGLGGSFMDCLSSYEKLNPYLESYFGGKYILNSFGGNLLQKDASYANSIHRDQRSYSGKFNLMLNTIVTLDDFTTENGATWLSAGGHRLEKKPTQEVFDFNAVQATAPSGSVIMVNSNCWHQAGENTTNNPRRSVTPIFSKPFVKPGYDYPRALGYDKMDSYSEYLQQVLGYHSRIPSTLSEWYRPKEKRFYRSNQE